MESGPATPEQERNGMILMFIILFVIAPFIIYGLNEDHKRQQNHKENCSYNCCNCNK